VGFVFFLLCKGRTRTHSSGTVRWTVPATSANTGGYNYFRQKRKCISSPADPTNNANRKRFRFGKPRNHNGFWVFRAIFQGAIQKISFSKNALWGGLEL